jgi:hypothetical protein
MGGPARLFSFRVAFVPLRRTCSLACCSHSCLLPLALSQPPRLRRHARARLYPALRARHACRPAPSLRLVVPPRLAYLRLRSAASALPRQSSAARAFS